MRLRPILFGDERHEPFFHFEGRLAGGEPQTVGDAEDVRIDGDGVAAEGERVDDVGGLPAHARERFELFARGGHFAAEAFQNISGSGEDVRRLVVIEPAGEDVCFEFFLREGEHLFGRVVLAEEDLRHLVDALVRALRGEHDGDEELVGRSELQGGARVGIEAGKLFQNFFLGIHAPIIARNRREGKRSEVLEPPPRLLHEARKGGIPPRRERAPRAGEEGVFEARRNAAPHARLFGGVHRLRRRAHAAEGCKECERLRPRTKNCQNRHNLSPCVRMIRRRPRRRPFGR